MLPSVLLVAAIAISGYGLSYWVPVRLRVEERVAAGVVLGVVAFCVTTFSMFLVVGMNGWTVAVGTVLTALTGASGAYRAGSGRRADLVGGAARLRLPMSKASSLRPLALLTAAAGVVATRTLALAYQTTSNGVSAGNLAIYGDWSAHLAYAGSFAFGDNRALHSPLAAGTPLRYHFLADYFAAPFTVTGATLSQALTLSAWVLALAFTPLLLCAVQRLTGSRLTSALTLLLFTLSGGVGAWYFVRDVGDQGWSALTTIPRTYARMPDEGIWLDNTISVSLYAQRSTLLGLCIGLTALIIVLSARVTWARNGFIVAGVLIGLTGIAHVHMLFSGLALGSVAWLFDRRREWGWFVLSAAVVGLPIAWAISPTTSQMRWLVGWIAAEENQSWPLFWLRNAGIFLPLFLGVAAAGAANKRLLRLTMPLWLWFIAANLISFHPWSGNNAKFFLFWQLGGCVVIADFLRRLWLRRGSVGLRVLRRAGAVVAFCALIVTGGVDTVRGMQRTTAFPWVTADEVVVADWLRAHQRPGDVLVYGATNTSATAALGGVPAVTGYPGWTSDLGLPDWYDRVMQSGVVLSGGEQTADIVRAYGVTWVLIGPWERYQYAASDEFWSAHGELMVQSGDYDLYRVAPTPKD
ncbi:MAG TPA: hypothetical protein PK020_14325 [Ilumatobacteraceae bacterium]|nr:hypothetical protein [Ilumatobacteraceae bacterium]HRB03227.1 hypothetical protein [Ilumatobacteraceae bacterium]